MPAMNNTKCFRFFAGLALLASLWLFPLRADPNPPIYEVPSICTPPPYLEPHEGDPDPWGFGYRYWLGGYDADNGVFYDPGYYPVGFPNAVPYFTRDVERPDTQLPPPAGWEQTPLPKPSWAIFDQETDGTYWFAGGYFNGHYYAEGYYLPTEIY